MSTSAFIGFKNDAGKIEGIRVNFDGYPDNILPWLQKKAETDNLREHIEMMCKEEGDDWRGLDSSSGAAESHKDHPPRRIIYKNLSSVHDQMSVSHDYIVDDKGVLYTGGGGVAGYKQISQPENSMGHRTEFDGMGLTKDVPKTWKGLLTSSSDKASVSENSATRSSSSGKYHINPKTGRPNKCTASVRACPYGGEENHYPSKQEAQKGFEKIMKKNLFTSHSR
jgi:hypothetical protein